MMPREVYAVLSWQVHIFKKTAMRIFKKITIAFLLLLFAAIIAAMVFLQTAKPNLEGTIVLEGIEQDVEVYFDAFGVPHIYAQNQQDAHFALGYVHAQDRLFQMEMVRRLSKGQLAEILGPDLLKADRLFRTLGFADLAKKSAAEFYALPASDPMKQAAQAYYQGINTFMESGPTPLEFTLLGIPKTPFTIEDTYAIFGYMAFSFAMAFRTDPLLTSIQERLGPDYLKDLDVHWTPGSTIIPSYGRNPLSEQGLTHLPDLESIFAVFPVAPWIGSNAWVIGPSKTKSGKVIFSNDTHMGFAQPSVWYEAHLECPGFELYGNHLAGVPFAIPFHNRHFAVGMTMLENDDIDLYREKTNPKNPNQVWFRDRWEDLSIRKETIKVKGQQDLVLEVKASRHGPFINEVFEEVGRASKDPIAAWWTFRELPNTSLRAVYQMSRAESMDEVRAAVALGNAPGLNIMYGDKNGNIAWWAMARLPKRPAHVHSKLFLDGASGEDEILGYLDFSENPSSENPPSGYVYSANNQPDSSGGIYHPGYYLPKDRALRITRLLETDNRWDMEKVQKMILDDQSEVFPEIIRGISANVRPETKTERTCLETLVKWDGKSTLDAVAPTIYAKIVYQISEKTFLDELGEADFKNFLGTHLYKRSFTFLMRKDSSLWYDNTGTSKLQEQKRDVVGAAFRQAVAELEKQLGPDVQQWKWGKVHTLEHAHALGQVPLLAKIFNVGPFPVPGNTEVINNLMFTPNANGQYRVQAGPAKRRIIDFGDIEHSVSVLPTGQSGNRLSPHYADQAKLFAEGKFREQKMNKGEITASGNRRLLLKKANPNQ
jgi:penicillin amidase